MRYFEENESAYNGKIKKIEREDLVEAEFLNNLIQELINNNAFVKKMLEQQGIDTQEQLLQQYEQLTGYTDVKIGQLINGAPETLDTIKEVANAILENKTVIEALNEAVGKKLNKDGDLTGTTATFTSEDEDEPTGWKKLGKLVSGKLENILGRVSIISNNLKYLYKIFGTTDISGLADGTLTGAVSKLNTDLGGIKFIDFGVYDHTQISVDDVVKEIFNKVPLAYGELQVCHFDRGQQYTLIVQSYQSRNYGSAILMSYSFDGIIFYRKIFGVVKRCTAQWTETEI